MITDKIENIDKYKNLSERIKKGIEFIQNTDLVNAKTGKYIIEGDNIYAGIDEYNTRSKDVSMPEIHKKYLDIQYIISGNELMGYAPFNNQQVVTEYNAEKDIAFLNSEVSFFDFKENHFAIFFPEELHMPCISKNESSPIKKVVVKVLIE